MKYIKHIKTKEREKAVSSKITEKELKEPLKRGKFRVLNPLRLVERKAVDRYNNLNWKEKTIFNKLIKKNDKSN